MPDVRTLQFGRDYETNLGSPCGYYSGFTVHLATWGPAVTMVSASVSSGEAPPGMHAFVCPGPSSTLNMVGAPYALGVYTFTVDALMSNGSHTTYDCVHTVALASGCPIITPNDASLSAKVGVAFSQTIDATGGTSPYTWDQIDGTLPPGISFSSGGVLSGTPTAAGTYTFALRATDAGGCQGSKPYAMVVEAYLRQQIHGRDQIKLDTITDDQVAIAAGLKIRKLQGGAVPVFVPDEMSDELPWVPGSIASAASTVAGDIKSNGTVAFAADESMGDHKLTDVKDATAAQDAVNVRTAENISVLTNGDATTPEIMFDATGDVIMTGI